VVVPRPETSVICFPCLLHVHHDCKSPESKVLFLQIKVRYCACNANPNLLFRRRPGSKRSVINRGLFDKTEHLTDEFSFFVPFRFSLAPSLTRPALIGIPKFALQQFSKKMSPLPFNPFINSRDPVRPTFIRHSSFLLPQFGIVSSW
jgi:hypothetical protein